MARIKANSRVHFQVHSDINEPLEWKSIRVGDLAHGGLTKTIHKTLPEGGWVGSRWWGWGSRNDGVQGVVGV